MSVKVSGSMMTAVRTKFYGPTDTKGSRVRVWRADTSWLDDECRVEVSWDYGLSSADNHVEAVREYLVGRGWDGGWVLGSTVDGYVAVSVEG